MTETVMDSPALHERDAAAGEAAYDAWARAHTCSDCANYSSYDPSDAHGVCVSSVLVKRRCPSCGAPRWLRTVEVEWTDADSVIAEIGCERAERRLA